jgi:hypothetical protein
MGRVQIDRARSERRRIGGAARIDPGSDRDRSDRDEALQTFHILGRFVESQPGTEAD